MNTRTILRARHLRMAGEGGGGGQGGNGGDPQGGGQGGNGGDPQGGGQGGNPPKNEPTGLDVYLEKLDEEGRKAVRGELEKARKDSAGYRERLGKYKDIDPDKAREALTKLDEIEQANKTEAQKAADARAAAEKERDTARTELLRERIGRRHGLSDTFVALLQGTDEDTMNAHAEKITAELGEARKRPGDAVPGNSKPNNSPGGNNSTTIDPKEIATAALADL